MKNTTNIEDIARKIDDLDLECIRVKLTSDTEGEGWSRAKASEVEKWYKRFLFLNHKHQTESVVPNKAIDTFWHYHILDTLKYKEDCEKVFGLTKAVGVYGGWE